MELKPLLLKNWKGGLVVTAVTAIVGWALLISDNELGGLPPTPDPLNPKETFKITIPRYGKWWVFGSYDWLFTARGSIPVSNAVIIAMDDLSHDELNQPRNQPWDRKLHANLVNFMHTNGARAVVFDIVFSDPAPDQDGSTDKIFAEAIRKAGNVILAADCERTEGGNRYVRPIEILSDAAARFGSAEMRPEYDMVVRRPLHKAHPDELLSSTAWATAEFLRLPAAQNEAEAFRKRWFNYYGPPGTVPRIPYCRYNVTNWVDPRYFSNKVVFVGGTLITKFSGQRKDEYVHPFRTERKTLFIPGVELQATQFLNLLHENWLSRPSERIEMLIAMAAAILAGFGLVRLKPPAAVAAAVVAVLAVFGLSYYLFVKHLIWVPWLVWVTQIILAMVLSVGANAFSTYVQNRLLEQSLAAHVPPARVKQLMQNRELLHPGAEKQELSILFSDIANFTTISEGMDSDDLAKMMNEYFEGAISRIHQADGTVIKLIGDAIFAIWNAPTPQPNHRELACRGALLLRDQVTQFIGSGTGKPLVTRIGLHTGVANVGNFGSTTRFDYTAIGENINLASRMEGLNKYLGTTVLATRDTQRAVEDKLITRYVGHFRLKGFEKAVEVYELIGDLSLAESTKPWRDAFAEALQHFKARNFDAAEAGMKRVLQLRPEDGPAKFYLKEIAEMRQNPPEPDWAGEIELKEK